VTVTDSGRVGRVRAVFLVFLCEDKRFLILSARDEYSAACLFIRLETDLSGSPD
jgi:hypothetical protein